MAVAEKTIWPDSQRSVESDVTNFLIVEVLPVPVSPTKMAGKEWWVRDFKRKVYLIVSSVGITILLNSIVSSGSLSSSSS